MRRRLSIAIFLLSAAASAFAQTPPPSASPGEKNEDGTVSRKIVPPPFEQFRFEENYEYLNDESLRAEPLDKLKYIRLGRKNWYLSLGGEARIRYESYRSANFGAGAQDRNGYLLQRYLFHADWNFGRKLRVFTQLQSGLLVNRTGGARPTDRNRLDLHQAFFDYRIFGGEKRSLIVRAGRQEIEFGAGRLISAGEGTNVRRSFDAVRPIYKQDKWTVNGLFAKLVANRKGAFDDVPAGDQTFWGAGAIRSRQAGRGGFSVYYLGLDRRTASFNGAAARREIRQTFGSRVWGVFGKLDYNYELIGQTGDFGGKPIRAFAVVTDTGYNLPKMKFQPRFGLRAGAASGDRNPRDGRLESFNPIFPGTAYSGSIALVGPTNIIDLTPSLRLAVNKKITVSLDSAFYWRQSANDGLYGIAVNLQRAGSPSRARFVGGLFSARADYRIDRHITYTAIYSHFLPGGFLRETPPGEAVDYFSTWITYRF